MSEYQLYHGDCLKLMPDIPDKSVDMILCDLPYGTTACKWDTIIPFEPLWEHYKRICSGAIVLTASQPFTSALVMSNIKMFKYCWVWNKSKITGVLNAKKQPVKNHEDILIFYVNLAIYNPQGIVYNPKITHQGSCSNNYGTRNVKPYIQEYSNYPRTILSISSEGKTVHPTQKPVALMEYMIKTYSHKGMTVMDNCMGSGTTGVACANTGRKFIGIEQDDKYFQIASDRIQKAYEDR